MSVLDFFFFNDTATTEIYTLSLHDALPILPGFPNVLAIGPLTGVCLLVIDGLGWDLLRRHPDIADRKSTRLNSSHANISYAVFCLKKKKTIYSYTPMTSSTLAYAHHVIDRH